MASVEEKRVQAEKILESVLGFSVDIGIEVEVLQYFLKANHPDVAKALEERRAYAYCALRTKELVSILVVLDDTDRYQADIESAQEGYVYAYVYNITRPEYSEFGTIKVDKKLNRIA
ncbi:hypothetical protein [Ligilactobacillus murinus]|uniref:Uncharacterized protein n=1 Tax=Ligilactobacillus murinus TaxID=1622 RepID=A0A4S2EHS7_9LACO|nr:hypothetical protein [Ligilactobacillus murinus]HAB49958.1 hypothetical protein [Lactobacillus sp.]MCR1879942.1 hypothetical protein [Ligilactobacillus murinus]NEF81851.1 hypothetical protein [Ligilactobacillus murinus]NEF83978.1 hypothetical protein [Ligilactobacillus murinus]NEF86437.1 hypothetical protein [Ligilactobacillus murinus]